MQEQEDKQAKKVKVKLLKTHTHGRKTYAPTTDDGKPVFIEVREDQAARLRAEGVAE
jgi:hypothetical protein